MGDLPGTAPLYPRTSVVLQPDLPDEQAPGPHDLPGAVLRVDEAVEEILGFFRVYHSMRYARERLVLRLKTAPDEAALEQIHDKFPDILTKGRFIVRGPLSGERDEPDLADLPRLVFQFNRRDQGRLRQLINWLNGNLVVG